MNPRSSHRHAQQAAVFVALLMFALVLLTIQLWLFVGALEARLRGNDHMALPAAVISLLIFGFNVWMFLGLRRIERQG